MAVLVTFDDVMRAETSGAGSRSIAATMIEWAEHPEKYELDDVTPAHLHLVAADHLEMEGDFDAAWARAEIGAAHPTAEPFEAHPTLISIRLAQGRVEDARALADEIRKRPIEDLTLVERIAGLFELADLLAEAQRWNAIGIRAAEASGDPEGDAALIFSTARYRVRRLAGLPRDVLDVRLEAWGDELDLPVPFRDL